MKAKKLIETLKNKLGSESQQELAKMLGVSVQMLLNWKNSDKDLSEQQIANALVKARNRAIREAQYHAIKPIIEYYPVNKHKTQKNYYIIDKSSSEFDKGVRLELENDDAKGIYIFYDSRGQALYVGQARSQSLWKEMNLAFNRTRDEVQSIILVEQPKRSLEFIPASEKGLQPKRIKLKLYDLAYYFSAYKVDDGMINDLEALLVRGFANSLLNIKMERFVHAKEYI